jgi:uridylate kinase
MTTGETKPLYNRVLLKLSGEVLMGSSQFGINPKVLDRLATEIAECIRANVQVGIVIGGGNLFRGKSLSDAGIGRVTGDHMGMLATVMNGLALRDALERIDCPARILSAVSMVGMVDPYNRRKAITHLRSGFAVIFTAGTGNPFFTTDTAACLRAIEVDADIVLKATKVDGVYDDDPMLNTEAKRFDRLSFDEVLLRNLRVMDHTAICLCRDYNMPIKVFNINQPQALFSVITGQARATLVDGGDHA